MEDQAEKLREMMRQKGENQEKAQPPAVKPSDQKKTRIITVASGKGGVGKTNVSVNMAIAYARLGKKVVVMDADLGLANVNIITGYSPNYSLYHVMHKQKTLKEILAETEYGISIIAGASGLYKLANLTDEERENFINELTSLSRADIIIIDTSAGVSKNVLDFIIAADEAVIITTTEPTAITDAYGITKIIASEMSGHSEIRLRLVVNRVKNAEEANKIADRMIGIAWQFLNMKIDYLGFIYEDPVVQQAVAKQKPFTVIDPKSKASLCVQHLVECMEQADSHNQAGGLSVMLKRLFVRA